VELDAGPWKLFGLYKIVSDTIDSCRQFGEVRISSSLWCNP
jgi:hypothetical protein